MPRSGLPIEPIIAGIVHRAGERGNLLTKLRLVKFLYLLDVFHAQSEGRTYTGWPWAFVHYGPYCRDSTDAIDHAEAVGFLSARSFESNYGDADFRLYGLGERLGEHEIEAAWSSLPLYVKSNLVGEVDRWSDDTYGLMDFVYFRTGPMAQARPGELLSFSHEKKPDFQAMKPIQLNSLSGNKIKKLRESLGRMKSKASGIRENSPNLYDEHYFRFLADSNEEETPVNLTGVARVHFPDREDD